MIIPSARSGASYNPASSSQTGYRRDYHRSQSVTEGKGSVNGSQTDKLCHSEVDNTVLPSNSTENTTRSLNGHIQSQKVGLQQLISAQGEPDPCRSVERLPEFLPDCEKIPWPSNDLQVTQWIASMDGKEKHVAFNRQIEKNYHPPPNEVPKTASVASSRNQKVKKKPQAQNKGKGKAPTTNSYSWNTASQIFNRMPYKMYFRWPEI
ncbi:hypothetical protein O181_008488 [Austropuccinia psidii MF-1]|uniref:Uncharacterized protein n=1 Tax=Austropuccinia psidii MF-1 TaxID=1389203 RepID=A0A9Q3GIJ6_9BASI|nr:hypothetical protein [Austropuccinia psidii MF-1]